MLNIVIYGMEHVNMLVENDVPFHKVIQGLNTYTIVWNSNR